MTKLAMDLRLSKVVEAAMMRCSSMAARTSDGNGDAQVTGLKVRWQHKEEEPFPGFRGLVNLGFVSVSRV